MLTRRSNKRSLQSSTICKSARHVFNNNLPSTERQSDRLRLYNFSSVGDEREWLRDTLLSSDTDSSSDEETPAAQDRRIRRLLKEKYHHNKYTKEYYKDPGVS